MLLRSFLFILLLSGCASSQGLSELLSGNLQTSEDYPLIGDNPHSIAAEKVQNKIASDQEKKGQLQKELEALANSAPKADTQTQARSQSKLQQELEALRKNHKAQTIQAIEKKAQ